MPYDHHDDDGHHGHQAGDLHSHAVALQTHAQLQALSDCVTQLLGAMRRTPRLSQVLLTNARPVAHDETGHDSLSIGVLNANDCVVYWGIGGAMPQPGMHAIAQPAQSLMVLPLAAQDLLLGAYAADLAAGDALLHVMRFETVQPTFLGAV